MPSLNRDLLEPKSAPILTVPEKHPEASWPVLCVARALWKFDANPNAPVDEMPFEPRDEFHITFKNSDGWWFALNDKVPKGGGWVPGNYMEVIETFD